MTHLLAQCCAFIAIPCAALDANRAAAILFGTYRRISPIDQSSIGFDI
jgi:hypothetical protein